MECKKQSYIRNNRGKWEHIKSSRKYLSKIHGKHKIKELQTTANTGHCRRILGSANVKGQKILTWEIALHVPYIETEYL